MPTPGYTTAAKYLEKYGYLAKSGTTHSSSLQTLSADITKLQAFAGLEQTGEIDKEMEQVMMMRRCGNEDIQDDQVRLMRSSVLPV